MLARFYIEDAGFSGVDVLRDKPPAVRERKLAEIQMLTEFLGFVILVSVLAALLVVTR